MVYTHALFVPPPECEAHRDFVAMFIIDQREPIGTTLQSEVVVTPSETRVDPSEAKSSDDAVGAEKTTAPSDDAVAAPGAVTDASASDLAFSPVRDFAVLIPLITSL